MNDPGVLKDIEKKHRPFATGWQWAEWDKRNCGSCRLGFDMKRGKFRCAHQFALTSATISNGEIEESTAKAIGYLDNFAPGWTDPGCYIWECPGWERGRK